jgi:hypothetical protein
MPESRHTDNHDAEAGMKPVSQSNRRITLEREEYDALMSELSRSEPEPKTPPSSQDIEERFRKIEFCMMIIVGLLLAVLVFSKAD